MRISPAIVLALLGACARLPDATSGTCGDGVLQPGEDCDGTSIPGCGHFGDGLRACRFTCARSEECPGGWACSPAGICIHGTLRFEESAAGSPQVGGKSLSVGDVDGDGRADVVSLGGGAAAVAFGDGQGGFRDVFNRPAAFESIDPGSAGDLDGDGRLDVVLPLPDGVAFLRGASNRQLVPVAFEAYPVTSSGPPALVLPVQSRPGAQALLVLDVSGNDLQAVVVPLPFQGHLGATVMLGPADELAHLPPRLPLLDLDGDGRQEVLLGLAGSDRIQVLGFAPGFFDASLDQVDTSWPSVAVEGTLSDPPQLLAADLDGDGRNDLLMRLASGEVALARGTAAGLETARVQEGLPWPLAVADLDGDGKPELVTPAGVFGGTPPVRLLAPQGAPWSEAVATDLDGDGRLDLAVAAEGEAVLRIFMSRCTDDRGPCSRLTFTAVPRSLPAPPALLRAADLDGLGTGDVAFVLDDSGGKALGVIFGQVGAEPTGLTVMGRFGSVDRLETAQLPDLAGNVDGAADLILTGRSPDGTTLLTVLAGAPGRVLDAPLALQSANVADAALSAQLGRFAVPGRVDLAAIGLGPRGAEVWSVAGPSPGTPIPLATARHGALVDLACLELHPADVDGDGVDELIGVSRRGCGSKAPVVALLRLGSQLVDVTGQALDAAPMSTCAADVDGDGKGDLVLPGERGVDVLWGPELSLVGASHLDVPAQACTVLQADDDVRPELILGGPDGVIVAQVEEGRILTAVTPPVASVRTVALAAGDLDGDGLSDMVVSDGLRLTVLRSVPHVDVR